MIIRAGMRTTTLSVLLACTLSACTGQEVREPVAIEFREEASAWVLTPAPATEESVAGTSVMLEIGTSKLDFGAVPGACQPNPELPFTEVQGQPAFAALRCDSPDGGNHDVVLVLVPSEDPSWPAPVALAMVLARNTADDSVALMTMGAQELPLGVTPKPPVVAAKPTGVAPEAPASPDTDE